MRQRLSVGAMVVVSLLGLRVGRAADPETGPTDDDVRAAVSRSLPFLEQAGVAWMNEKGCMSCHHVPMLLWTHHVAKAKGLGVDAGKLAEWEVWARNDSNSHRSLFKLTKERLAAIDAAKLPEATRQKIGPLVDQVFRAEADYVQKLAELLGADELAVQQGLLVEAGRLPTYAWERSGGGLDVVGQLILGGGYAASQNVEVREFRDNLRRLIQEYQLPDGTWAPGNQYATMRRWPGPAAVQATSLWAALALAADEPRDQPTSAQVAKVVEMLKQQPPQGDNHEWLAVRYLFELKIGQPAVAANLRQQLLDSRKSDGGWSWEKQGPSDPYTTGLVLYVLAEGDPKDQPAVFAAARAYLLKTQQPDGSWQTASKNISKTNDPERLKARDKIYEYWGSAWAALGLAKSLP